MSKNVKIISIIFIVVLSLWLGVRGQQLVEKKKLINASFRGNPVNLMTLDSILGTSLDNHRFQNRYFIGLIYNPISCDCSIGRINKDITTIDSLMILNQFEYEIKIFFLGNHEKLGNVLVNEMNNSFHGLSTYLELDLNTYKALGEPIGDGLLLVTRPTNQTEGKLYKIGVVLQNLETASKIL